MGENGYDDEVDLMLYIFMIGSSEIGIKPFHVHILNYLIIFSFPTLSKKAFIISLKTLLTWKKHHIIYYVRHSFIFEMTRI